MGKKGQAMTTEAELSCISSNSMRKLEQKNLVHWIGLREHLQKKKYI